MVDEFRAFVHRLFHKHARIPTHPVGVAVVAEGEIRLPAVLVHVLVQQPPVIPQADGALHDTARHGRDHFVLQRCDGQFRSRFRDFVAYMDAILLEHVKGCGETGPVIKYRAAARAHGAHYAQHLMSKQNLFARNPEPFERLPRRPGNRIVAAPFQQENTFLTAGKFLCHRGASRPRAHNDRIIRPACCFHNALRDALKFRHV
ncbi:MAG: hypothetical protein BWX80_03983 [Candidatus Hydrogenedentes bacterium ADurb.Bin101]|nr:MAG: hypothetical protein BWX80_03983 [Candidatus Hydrogenedentes bacterium ADurb.Bin101]